MILKIRTLKGETFKVEIDQSASFYELKSIISKLRSLPIDLQKLVFKGKQMQNEHMIIETGVREEDTLVLMQTVMKKKKNEGDKVTVEKNQIKDKQQKNSTKQQKQKPRKEKDPEFEAKILEIEAMGYPRDKITRILTEADGNVERALNTLIAGEEDMTFQINQTIKQEIMKVLNENQQLLRQQNGGNGAPLGIDLENAVNTLGLSHLNSGLKKQILENPGILNQLLMGGMEDEDENLDDIQENEIEQEYEQGEGEGEVEGGQLSIGQYHEHQVEITSEDEESIISLMALGFQRGDVIDAFVVCQKNMELAANLLFERQANGDYDYLN